MRITIDTIANTLTCDGAQHFLFGPRAFDILSRLWLDIGWRLGHWTTLSWMGRQIVQFPDDVLRLAEAVWLERPDVVVETGVYEGGSTLLFAALCRLQGHGRVISIENSLRPGVREAIERHGGGLVTLIEGDSATARVDIQPGERVFVFLDSDHSTTHVTAELENFAPVASCIVVADTNQPEPLAAVDAFLDHHPEFVREPRAPLYTADHDFSNLSYFPRSWLRRRE